MAKVFRPRKAKLKKVSNRYFTFVRGRGFIGNVGG